MKAPFMAASLLSLAAVVGCNPAADSGPAATGDGNAAAVVPEGATLVSFDVPDMH